MDAAELSDAQLWQRARDGDERAFGELFSRHSRRVYNYCFRRLGSWATAEDAVQQVFIELWRKRDVAFVEDSLLPFALGVANNVVRNATRAAGRFTSAIASLPAPMAEPDHADAVAGRVDDEQQMRQVLAALRRLRRAEQDVVALCDWEGLSYEATATALGVPIGTVRSRLSRARRHLRAALALGELPAPSGLRRPDETRGES